MIVLVGAEAGEGGVGFDAGLEEAAPATGMEVV